MGEQFVLVEIIRLESSESHVIVRMLTATRRLSFLVSRLPQKNQVT